MFRTTARGPMDFATFGRWIHNGGIEFQQQQQQQQQQQHNNKNRRRRGG